MTDQTELLDQTMTLVDGLLGATKLAEIELWGEAGAAFPVLGAAEEIIVREQARVFVERLAPELYSALRKAYSNKEATDEYLWDRVKKIVPKASAFCPALTAGELPDEDSTERLVQGALAISLMYGVDETMDQPGGEAMVLAVKRRYGDSDQQLDIPASLEVAVNLRTNLLVEMEEAITRFASPEDRERLLRDYANLVLANEATLTELSLKLLKIRNSELDEALKATQEQEFMQEHAVRIGRLAVADAGVQSVVDTLYQEYQRKCSDPDKLASLKVIYGSRQINGWMNAGNAAARIGDDKGDAPVDAGLYPELGLFSINPFNQPNETLISTYAEEAGMNAVQIEVVKAGFRGYANAKTDAERKLFAKQVTDAFFAHIRQRTFKLLERARPEQIKFIKLGMRVLTISVVNMWYGEVKLAGLKETAEA